ncbi:hypothetical protein BDN70DRAFT_808896 [Pholiota conissans]|uniref:Arrestin-like N-terminal domain-containing protein n=1 Tax=Pholiota conissans TaxID=109636 RepID=A0A9P5Z1G8_9AGAR|nr:hypothetical protein BDN70DRAFT_808896 [Pholiota conissans]
MTAVIPPGSISASALPLNPNLPPRYSLLDGVLPSTDSTTSREPSPSPPASVQLQSQSETYNRRPPRYSSVFNRTRIEQREQRQRARHGPSSSSRRHSAQPGNSSTSTRSRSGPQLHEYNLRNGNGTKGAPYATLRVYSPTSSAGAGSLRIPKFVGEDLVQGSLDLNLDTPANINSISLSLRGRIITSAYDGGSHTFLEHSVITVTPARPKKFDGKFSGAYSWPFSFSFPQQATSVAIPEADCNIIPQSFTEKEIKASVQYELVLRMTHGLLRSDSKLHAPVVYMPAITPPRQPTSSLRDIAYRAGVGMPSPDVDPIGWMVVGKKTMQGRIFKERSVKLQCTLSLANPQSYMRGTVIPCHLAIESSDAQALDVLVTPQTLRLRLVRRARYYDQCAAANSSAAASAVIEDVTEIERAVWWVNAHADDQATSRDANGVTRRALEGEIHLEKELQPSSSFARPTNSSSSPSSSKFPQPGPKTTDATASSLILISHPVTITSLPGEGPTPVSHTAPTPRQAKTRTVQVQARTHEGYEYEYAPGASARVIAGAGVYM